MSKICIGYNDITKEYIYMDNNTGITSISKEWLNVPYEPDNNVERFVLDMSIADLKKELELTEKALELACEDKPRPIKYYGNYMGSVNDYIEFYKTKAKEMKDET